MMLLLISLLLLPWAQATLHHLFVGTVDGSSLYTLEFDDTYKLLNIIQNVTAAGASPSIVVEGTRQFLFGSRPEDASVSRYEIQPDYSLILDGTMQIPTACNTTSYQTIHLLPSINHFDAIYGTATNNKCSTLFAFSTSGHYTQHSAAITGSIRSLTFSPSGLNLQALNSGDGTPATSSILTFSISLSDPTLSVLTATDPLINATSPSQLIPHPANNYIYLVTSTTNQLVAVPINANTSRPDPTRETTYHSILPRTPSPDVHITNALAIGYSNGTIWTLTSSPTSKTAIVTVFLLDQETGAVGRKVARAAFATAGGKDVGRGGMEASITAAPWMAGENMPPGDDLVVVTTWPGGVVAVLGLDNHGDGSAPKIKSWGRAAIGGDEGCCGESVWLD